MQIASLCVPGIVEFRLLGWKESDQHVGRRNKRTIGTSQNSRVGCRGAQPVGGINARII